MGDELRDLRDWLPYSPEACVEVTFVMADGILRCDEVPGTANDANRRGFAKGEGVWWIRGHHDEDSVEGKALLAAYALDRSLAA